MKRMTNSREIRGLTARTAFNEANLYGGRFNEPMYKHQTTQRTWTDVHRIVREPRSHTVVIIVSNVVDSEVLCYTAQT